MGPDYTARNEISNLRDTVDRLSGSFDRALRRIEELEEETRRLKDELAPKKLDKTNKLPSPPDQNGAAHE